MSLQESETIEFKAIVVEDIKNEVAAFANSQGGTLFVGVLDDGEWIGVDDVDAAMLQISNMVRDAIKPDVTMFVRYEVLTQEDKQVIAVHVSAAPIVLIIWRRRDYVPLAFMFVRVCRQYPLQARQFAR